MHGVVVGDGHRQRHHRRATHRQLQFHITYDKSVDLLGSEMSDYVVNTLMKDSVDFWQSVLSVIPASAPIRLNRLIFSRRDDSLRFYLMLCYFSRKCNGGTYYRMEVNGVLQYVCTSRGCANVTSCGEVEIPADHLNVNLFFSTPFRAKE